MQEQNQKELPLPGVGFKKLKKILKKCRRDLHSHDDHEMLNLHDPHQISANCPHLCPGRYPTPPPINTSLSPPLSHSTYIWLHMHMIHMNVCTCIWLCYGYRCEYPDTYLNTDAAVRCGEDADVGPHASNWFGHWFGRIGVRIRVRNMCLIPSCHGFGILGS